MPALPNAVLLFVADDIGIGDISSSGFNTTLVQTPNIDALAAQGARFTHMHSTASLCAPSRYSLLTGNLPMRGLMPEGEWMLFKGQQVKSGQRTLGHLFSDAGFATALIGKMHLGGGLANEDGSATSKSSAGDGTVDWARGILQRMDLGFEYVFESHDGIQSPPFIYWENGKPVSDLAYHDASQTWSWAVATSKPRQLADYEDAEDFLPQDADGDGAFGVLPKLENHVSSPWAFGYLGWDSTRTGELYVQAARDFIDEAASAARPLFLQFHSQGVHVPHTPSSTFRGAAVRNTYPTRHLDMVHEVDLQMQSLLERLGAHGLAETTLAIFTSDNGGLQSSESTGHRASGPLHGYKGFTVEGGHRVPFVVSWPGVVPAGAVCDHELVHTTLFATFAQMLGRLEDEGDEQGMDSLSAFSYFTDLDSACGASSSSSSRDDEEGGGDDDRLTLVQQTKKPRRAMVAYSPSHLKVVALRDAKGMPYAAAIADDYTFVDLAADPYEASCVGKSSNHSCTSSAAAGPGVQALYARLAAAMASVAAGDRTTPPLHQQLPATSAQPSPRMAYPPPPSPRPPPPPPPADNKCAAITWKKTCKKTGCSWKGAKGAKKCVAKICKDKSKNCDPSKVTNCAKSAKKLTVHKRGRQCLLSCIKYYPNLKLKKKDQCVMP